MKTRLRWVLCCVALGVWGCGGKTEGATETNTNWLRVCENSSQCSEGLECLCGKCTVTCEASSECAGENRALACFPTNECEEASPVCGSKSAAREDEERASAQSLLCERPIEDYEYLGSPCAIDLNCDGVAFTDICGCGCTDAPASENTEENGGQGGETATGSGGVGGVTNTPPPGGSGGTGGVGTVMPVVPSTCFDDPRRTYYGTSLAECEGADIDCPTTEESTSVPFYDACGCGCVDVSTVCGDGTVDEDEECDDANNVDGDGCESDCTTPVAPVQHATCDSPFPEVAPSLPEVRQDATGRPLFDTWRDIDCDATGVPLCTESSNWLCFKGTPDAETGFETYRDIDIECDGEGEVIGYNDGACWMCAPLEGHAQACCSELPGFDCRAWPFPADGKPGMVCARHEDCEAGLVCGDTGANGYGICQCPGVSLAWSSTCDFVFETGGEVPPAEL